MTIGASGIRASQSKIEAIARLRESEKVEELSSMLGMTGYLWRYIKGYSNTVAPLTDLLLDGWFATKRARRITIPWGPQQQQAFIDLKDALMSYPILACPDWNEQFVLHSDASEYAAGAALAQEADNKSGSSNTRVIDGPGQTRRRVHQKEKWSLCCGQWSNLGLTYGDESSPWLRIVAR